MNLDRYIDAFYRGDFHPLRLLALQAQYKRTDIESILDVRIIEPVRTLSLQLETIDPFSYLEDFLSLQTSTQGIHYIAGAKHEGYKPLLFKGYMDGQQLTAITDQGKSRLAKKLIEDIENNPFYESDIHCSGWNLRAIVASFLKLGVINLQREWRSLWSQEMVKYNEDAILELYDEAMVRRTYI